MSLASHPRQTHNPSTPADLSGNPPLHVRGTDLDTTIAVVTNRFYLFIRNQLLLTQNCSQPNHAAILRCNQQRMATDRSSNVQPP